MAISVAWQTTVTCTTAPTGFYTVPSTTAATSFYPYARDLVLCNAGTGTLFVSLDASTAATSVAGFKLPAGGSVLLTQCQVPQAAIVGAAASSTATTSTYLLSIGYATNVAYI